MKDMNRDSDSKSDSIDFEDDGDNNDSQVDDSKSQVGQRSWHMLLHFSNSSKNAGKYSVLYSSYCHSGRITVGVIMCCAYKQVQLPVIM
jgi:hypothetical protein